MRASGAPDAVRPRHQRARRLLLVRAGRIRRRRYSGMMARSSRSPFGASLKGTRDQPRRMSALGYNVWLIRWITFVYAASGAGSRACCIVYYHSTSTRMRSRSANSAEVLLMVIAGGAGHAGRAGRRRRASCAAEELWPRPTSSAGTCCSAASSCSSSCSCRRPGAGLPQLWQRFSASRQAAASRFGAGHDRRARDRSEQALRRPAGHPGRLAHGDAGRAAADHRPERRRQDHAVQPDHRRPRRRRRLDRLFGAGARSACAHRARASRPRAHLPDHHAVPARHARAQRRARAARARPARWNRWSGRCPARDLYERGARGAGAASGLATSPQRVVAEIAYGEKRPRRDRHGAGAEAASVLLLDEPLAGLSQRGARDRAATDRRDPARDHDRDDRARHGHGARSRRDASRCCITAG